ncbi:hypothetical protein QP027_11880 [Corynebacterium breve]|uniref:Uncharacterized protein n=1 Tax=Corynebacterium breve TaxID=3049799 RepID=A0ABY8VDL5_9CORY|nr:hypothetical protein [Corynebacterium breve]WIM67756.1 hypothetical protein QP027_11880 [Corynebacterium breve]
MPRHSVYESGVITALQRHAFQAAERAGHLVTTRGPVTCIVFCGQVLDIEYGSAETIEYSDFERAVLDWATEVEQAFHREDTAGLSDLSIEAARAIRTGDWLAVPVKLDDDQLLRILEAAAKLVSSGSEASKFV